MNNMMMRVAAIFTLGVMMMGVKCTSTPSTPKIEKPTTPVATTVYQNIEKVETATENIAAETEQIKQSAVAISESATIIKDSTDDPKITEEASKIVVESNKVENATISIQKETEMVKQEIVAEKTQPLLNQIQELEKTNSDWKKKYDDLVAASTAEIQKIVRIFWMVGFAFFAFTKGNFYFIL